MRFLHLILCTPCSRPKLVVSEALAAWQPRAICLVLNVRRPPGPSLPLAEAHSHLRLMPYTHHWKLRSACFPPSWMLGNRRIPATFQSAQMTHSLFFRARSLGTLIR
ncbi:hypothetical protein OF83DRAFT_254431 [Amylostereum chailletii]|nr:hypothetical protein OF83DRAFT_254431 [Amylostereum chailletii]